MTQEQMKKVLEIGVKLSSERDLDRLLEEDACFSLKQLAVKGGDLLALGLSGPAVGRALEALLDKVTDGELPNERETLLAYLRGDLGADGKEDGK